MATELCSRLIPSDKQGTCNLAALGEEELLLPLRESGRDLVRQPRCHPVHQAGGRPAGCQLQGEGILLVLCQTKGINREFPLIASCSDTQLRDSFHGEECVCSYQHL